MSHSVQHGDTLVSMTAKDHFSIRVNPEAMAQIEAIAKEEGRTRSDVLRRLLAEALATRSKK